MIISDDYETRSRNLMTNQTNRSMDEGIRLAVGWDRVDGVIPFSLRQPHGGPVRTSSTARATGTYGSSAGTAPALLGPWTVRYRQCV